MYQIETSKFYVIVFITMIFSQCRLFSQTADDVLTVEMTGIENTGSYYSFKDKKLISNAVYAGNMLKSKEGAMGLRASDNSGIVSTASGGIVKSVIVKWNTSSLATGNKSVKIYGKNTAYSSAEDLYQTGKTQGVQIGTVSCKTAERDTLIVDGDYQYIGICSGNGTVYIDEMTIVWQSAAYSKVFTPTFLPVPGKYSDTQYVRISEKYDNIIYYTIAGSDSAVEDYSLYDGNPICIDESATIKAFAIYEESGEKSDTVTAVYFIERIFAFDRLKATTILGRTFIAPILTNTYIGGTVTWDSSDESVAVVDNNGNGTPVSAGTTTIKAILTLPDVEPMTASYVLTVNNAPEVPVGCAYYKRVMSDADIVDGGIYLIVNEDAGMAMGEISGAGKGVGIDIENNICMTSDDVEIVLERQSAGTYTLRNSQGYIGYKSGTDFGETQKSAANNNYKWEINVVRPDSVAIRNCYYKNRCIRFRPGGPEFRVYDSFSNNVKVTLYRKMGALKITTGGHDTDGRYYATYFTDVPFIVPEDIDCSTVGVTGNRLVVNKYNSGDIVPACSGLLVSAFDAGIYEYIVTSKPGNVHSGNLLKGDVTDMTTEGDGCMFFRLAKPVGEALGFWWGAPDGAAFVLGAYKAYLAVPNGISMAKGFSFGMATTGIEHPAYGKTANNDYATHGIYNVGGMRITHKPKPGMYIMGGRKVIIKNKY